MAHLAFTMDEMPMKDTLLIVMDPQRAFVDAAGSLARAYGISEVRPGIEALGRLPLATSSRSNDWVFLGVGGLGFIVVGLVMTAPVRRPVHAWTRARPPACLP